MELRAIPDVSWYHTSRLSLHIVGHLGFPSPAWWGGSACLAKQAGIGKSCHLQKITVFVSCHLKINTTYIFFVLKVAFLPQLWSLCSIFWCSSYAIFSKERFGVRVGTKHGPESLLVWCFLFHTGHVTDVSWDFLQMDSEYQPLNCQVTAHIRVEVSWPWTFYSSRNNLFAFCKGLLPFCFGGGYLFIWTRIMSSNYSDCWFSSRTGSGDVAKGIEVPFCCAILCPIFTGA